MKLIFKYLLYIFVILIVFIFIFFFWASSSSLNKNQYKELIDVNKFQPQEKDSVFTIVTYNIGYLSGLTNNKAIEKPKSLFDENLKKVLFQTEKANPDIIAFQEIDYNSSRSFNTNQEEEIANLGYNFRARSINWDERYLPFPYWPINMHFGKVISGQSIISKYPLRDHKRIVLDRVDDAPFYRDAFYLDRLVQVVKVNLDNKDVIVINVHLEAFDKPTRVKQFNRVLSIFNDYRNEYPTILLGDFNSKARDESAIIQNIFNLNDEIGNAAFNEENPTNSFDSKNPSKRIDYIFYTKNTIKYISGKVLNEFEQASDHLPILMKFKLK